MCFFGASREQEKIAFPDEVFKTQDEKVPEREREVSSNIFLCILFLRVVGAWVWDVIILCCGVSAFFKIVL